MPNPVRIDVRGGTTPATIVPGGETTVVVTPITTLAHGPPGPAGPAGPVGPVGPGGAGVVVSSTQPTNPQVGMIWVQP